MYSDFPTYAHVESDIEPPKKMADLRLVLIAALDEYLFTRKFYTLQPENEISCAETFILKKFPYPDSGPFNSKWRKAEVGYTIDSIRLARKALERLKDMKDTDALKQMLVEC